MIRRGFYRLSDRQKRRIRNQLKNSNSSHPQKEFNSNIVINSSLIVSQPEQHILQPIDNNTETVDGDNCVRECNLIEENLPELFNNLVESSQSDSEKESDFVEKVSFQVKLQKWSLDNKITHNAFKNSSIS